jgi:DNA-binding CsgD family transcriptional regulator
LGKAGISLIRNDQRVIQNNQIFIGEEKASSSTNQLLTFLVIKVPIQSSTGDVIGTLGNSIQIDDGTSGIKNHIRYHKNKPVNFNLLNFQSGVFKYLEKLAVLSPKQYDNICNLQQVMDLVFHQINYYRKFLFLIEKTCAFIKDLDYINSIRNVSHTYEFAADRTYMRFSNRELQCLAHFFLGRSAKETSRILGISPKTVESYWRGARIKSRCYNRSQLMRFILEKQLMNDLLHLI